MGGDGEGQADVHAAAVAFDGRIQEFFDFGEGDDFVEFAFDFGAAHAQHGAVQVDVFASGQFGVKSGADFQQAGHAPFDADAAGGRFGDAAEDFQQRGFARAVASDDADGFAPADFEGNIAERPEIFGGALRAKSGARVAKERFGAVGQHVTQGFILLLFALVLDSVTFAEVFGANDYIRHDQVFRTGGNRSTEKDKALRRQKWE